MQQQQQRTFGQLETWEQSALIAAAEVILAAILQQRIEAAGQAANRQPGGAGSSQASVN